MSPQFVDFDSDGTLDIVAGIFDGSPHLSRGSTKGYLPPEQILDRDGARIVMTAMWDHDGKPKRWVESTRCDPEGHSVLRGHLTSAWSVDWDGDRDLDLLLGDHDHGQVMWRRNDGTATKPMFATKNEWVLQDEQPMVVPGTVTTLRTIDWDRDGALDLLIGSMGDPYAEATGGGVFLYRNLGTAAAPKFSTPVVLIEPSQKGHRAVVRPDAGLYMDAGDIDGDSDLDLVVGGYSMWTPPARTLTEAETARAEELRLELEALSREAEAFAARVAAATDQLPEDEAMAKRKELYEAEAESLSARTKSIEEKRAARELLVPGPMRRSFTWLYENLAVER